MADQGRGERTEVVDGSAYIEERWTRSGVRLRARVRREGPLNWLFLPGGPGIGSESLLELVDALDVPGTCWLVDLPGDGSNTDPPGAGADPYSGWPQVLIEAAVAVPNPVYVGHSTGGMYLLSTPALDENLAAIAVRSAAWNFSPGTVEVGAELLARMPYNGAAVAWSAQHFDETYTSPQPSECPRRQRRGHPGSAS